MGKAAPFGWAGKNPFALGVVAVQRVVEPGDHPRGVAEGRVLGDVFDPLAVDPDLAVVVQALYKFLAGVRQHRGHYRLPAWPARRAISMKSREILPLTWRPPCGRHR